MLRQRWKKQYRVPVSFPVAGREGAIGSGFAGLRLPARWPFVESVPSNKTVDIWTSDQYRKGHIWSLENNVER